MHTYDQILPTHCSSHRRRVIPKTKKVEGTYDFHIALADAFRTLDKSSCSQQEKTVYSALIRECLLGCISQWKTSPVKPGTPAHSLYHYHAQPQAPSPTILKGRIESLVRLCLSLKDDRLCVEVFNAGGPTHQMDVLTAIRSHIGNTNPAWVLEPLRVALATYSTPALSDVPTLAWIAEKVGPGAIETMQVSPCYCGIVNPCSLCSSVSLRESRSLGPTKF